MTTLRKCPRCDSGVILNENGALSRLTRDEGAEVLICNRCGERESLYGRAPEYQRQMEDWPLDIETLVGEERELLLRTRGSAVAWIPTDNLEGGTR